MAGLMAAICPQAHGALFHLCQLINDDFNEIYVAKILYFDSL